MLYVYTYTQGGAKSICGLRTHTERESRKGLWWLFKREREKWDGSFHTQDFQIAFAVLHRVRVDLNVAGPRVGNQKSWLDFLVWHSRYCTHFWERERERERRVYLCVCIVLYMIPDTCSSRDRSAPRSSVVNTNDVCCFEPVPLVGCAILPNQLRANWLLLVSFLNPLTIIYSTLVWIVKMVWVSTRTHAT
jgi:hypothetical protein